RLVSVVLTRQSATGLGGGARRVPSVIRKRRSDRLALRALAGLRGRYELEPRLRRRSVRGARGDARVVVRRDGRGARVPERARAFRPVPSGGRARAPRRLAAARALGRGGGVCRGGVTSIRSG